ncbi:hypothetical protein PR048_032028 [Dryococelus australis]|uniref:Uncharacterized protein n=1 Tax=Dryococelus australis TaxID=614101 RepID=A0ABQ9G6Y7_9NEOP|nr:hypothetical protein PR048_032028 [Dryococelus australis]
MGLLLIVLHIVSTSTGSHLYKTHSGIYFEQLSPDILYEETIPLPYTLPLHNLPLPATKNVANALENILAKRKPNTLQSENGLEFYKEIFKQLMEKHNIN